MFDESVDWPLSGVGEVDRRRGWAELFQPARARVVVVGDLAPGSTLDALDPVLSRWTGEGQPLGVPPVPLRSPAPEASQSLVETEGPRSRVYAACPLDPARAGVNPELLAEWVSAELVSWLRERQGLSYSPFAAELHLSGRHALWLSAEVPPGSAESVASALPGWMTGLGPPDPARLHAAQAVVLGR